MKRMYDTMKSLVGTVNGFVARNSNVACVLASLASVYVTTLGFFYYQMETPNYQQAEPSAAPIIKTEQAHEPLVVPNEIAFVSQIIKSAIPKHPNRDALASLIVTESRKADIDPLFVTAVVRAESMFKNNAISHRGARGLMQLMPKTGLYVSKLHNISLQKDSDLQDPATNLRLGIAYLKYLDKKFNGHREQMLIAYNWGPANMSNSLKGKSSPPSGSVLYARSILSNHQEWSSSLLRFAAVPSASSIG